MRMRAEWRAAPALGLVVLYLAGCGSRPAPAVAPSGTCSDSGSTTSVPCIGMSSGTTVAFKVLPPPDSGSTSTVPYSALTVTCQDSGSTSTVPCIIVVKKP